MARITPNMDGPVGSFGLLVDGVRYSGALDWNIRTADWRCTLTRTSDSASTVGYARISPGTMLCALPDGSEVYVGGSDPYTIDAFTRGEVWLEWFAAENVAQFRAAEAPPNPGFNLV